jgi:hypothetical protein
MDTRNLNKAQVHFSKDKTTAMAFIKGVWHSFTRDDIGMDWKPITEDPPQKGWYVAAVLPSDFDPTDMEKVNIWRSNYGFIKVYFDPTGLFTARWQKPNGDTMDYLVPCSDWTKPVELKQRLLITHWAFQPTVPILTL